MINYKEYKCSIKDYLIIAVVSLVIIITISYLFYKSLIASVMLSPISILVFRLRKNNLKNKRIENLSLQFKDCILSISTSLTTGYSIENSLKEAYKEMCILHGEHSHICGELKNMIRKVEVNLSIESVFLDLAKRTDIEDIHLFVSVFQIAKKGGGDLTKVIKSAADNISEKIEVKKEIATLISAKKYEQNIMNFIPLIIIIYINFTSPSLLKPLYGNVFGIMIMSICLIVYGFAYFLSQKIMNIEV